VVEVVLMERVPVLTSEASSSDSDPSDADGMRSSAGGARWAFTKLETLVYVMRWSYFTYSHELVVGEVEVGQSLAVLEEPGVLSSTNQ